jgi:two-component system, CitB family, sensor kinase
MRPRRLSTRILASQLVVLVVALASGFFLFTRELRSDIDRGYEARALSIAEAAANNQDIRAEMASGDREHLVAALAESLRQATGASYIVVIDRNRIRHSHPDPALIGKPVEEPLTALDGKGHVGIDRGGLGRSANGKAPLRAPDGTIIGEVSAGILERHVSAAVERSLPTLVGYSVLALLLGVGVSFLLARRLKRQTFGLELDEIAQLLQEREAMLHGVSEGVITVDADGRVSLVNEGARRLLGIGATALHSTVDELVPAGRLRDLLSGAAGEVVDETVLTDDYVLIITRMPVSHGGRPLGAVITVRDRTELAGLVRELDSVRSLTDALRAQQHEHANRMHALSGLLELGRYDEAQRYLSELSAATAGTAEQLRDQIGDPTIVALLLAKVTIAAERGVELSVVAAPETGSIEDVAVKTRVLVSIIGNLVDNAIDAAAAGDNPQPHVVVRFGRPAPTELEIVIADNGPGVGDTERIFTDGYSTKQPREGAPRGLGLALVHRLVVRNAGRIVVSNEGGAVFRVTLPVRARVSTRGATAR